MSATEPRRTDGFAPIESYAAIGDGRTCALVALDGNIDWWTLPTVAAPPVFAALLDTGIGGHLQLQPAGEFRADRRYVPNTNVLETTFHTSDGRVRVTDSLNVGRAGRLPWSELARRVEGLAGAVDMRWGVVPGSRFHTAQPWTEQTDRGVMIHSGDQHLGLRLFDVGDPVVEPDRVHGSWTVHAEDRALIAVTSSDAEPVFLASRGSIEARLDHSVASWQEWGRGIRTDGRWGEAVRRSAFALKLALYAPTGAVTAAPTTSLPERIGGPKNWDYRFSWVRDSTFTLDALIALGLEEEVHSSVSWLLDTVARTAPDVHVFYTLDGSVAGGSSELDLTGYRGSRPVLSGNGASGQAQLGTFGDLFDTVWRYVELGHALDAPTGRLLATLADRCCDLWLNRDAGLWELGDTEHYTISKINCWVAMDRALRLCETGMIATGHADRWKATRCAIKSWVDEHCWSAASAYSFYAGTDDLDAATLLAARTGFDRGQRLASTVDAVNRELRQGPMVFRYSGMQEQEGAFLACSFWLVEALHRVGRTDEAVALMDEAVALANDVGLLSEQRDVRTGELLGNMPQALSHLALINAATALADQRGVA